MNFELLYQNLVKDCKKCNGTGTINSTETDIVFCDCLSHYIFIVKMLEVGVPLKYVMSFSRTDVKHKLLFFYKDDQTAFNAYMSLASDNIISIHASNVMFEIKDFEDKDGIMVYGLGLETFQNNSLTLLRLIKEAEDRGLYGIFSFVISRENLKTYYADFVSEKINQIENEY